MAWRYSSKLRCLAGANPSKPNSNRGMRQLVGVKIDWYACGDHIWRLGSSQMRCTFLQSLRATPISEWYSMAPPRGSTKPCGHRTFTFRPRRQPHCTSRTHLGWRTWIVGRCSTTSSWIDGCANARDFQLRDLAPWLLLSQPGEKRHRISDGRGSLWA